MTLLGQLLHGDPVLLGDRPEDEGVPCRDSAIAGSTGFALHKEPCRLL